MSFIVQGNKGNFLNAKAVKDANFVGKMATILNAGEIKDFKSKEGISKPVWNIPIEIEKQSFIFTPNATNLAIMTVAWGKEQLVDGVMQRGIEQVDVVGKQFKINLVKVKFRGETMDGIQIEPTSSTQVKTEKIQTAVKL